MRASAWGPGAWVLASAWLCVAPTVIETPVASRASAAPAASAVPDADFLEFLGEWHTEQGTWQNPLELERATDARTPSPRQGRTDGHTDRRAAPNAAGPRDPSSKTDRPADSSRLGDGGRTGASRE